MAVQRSTKVQVQAYRFGVRRVEHAVQAGVAFRQNLHGPRHGLAMVIGLVVSGLVLAGFAVYGFIKPAPSIRDAKVLVDTDSGSAFVVRSGVVYPALNLASAMLAAEDVAQGAAGDVRQVNKATLSELPRGQLLGIPGAPHQVPTEAALVSDTWTVCDVITRDPAAAPGMTFLPKTTVTIGLAQPTTTRAPMSALVTPDGRSFHLLFDGRRALVENIGDRVIAEGLGLAAGAARRVSLALLNAIPEVPPIRKPVIPGVGSATTLAGRTFRVGDVVTVQRASGGAVHLVVFADGVQEISPALADLVRASTRQPAAPILVSPAELATARPTSTPLDVASYPTHRPQLTVVDAAPALCLDWRIHEGAAKRSLYAAAAVPLPSGAVPVPAPPLAASGGSANEADAVYLPPGGGLVIGQATDGVTPNAGNLFLITDQGIKYPVVSMSALQALGLGKTVAAAPAELLALLPLGPTLDRVPARRFFGEQPRGNG